MSWAQPLIHQLPQLKGNVNGRQVDLVEWGVQQYLSGQFQFEINQGRLNKLDAYTNAKQVLRWIRYLSAQPNMSISEDGYNSIVNLMKHLMDNQRRELIQLFQNSTYDAKKPDLGKKFLDALQKLQMYTADSLRTVEILQHFGITNAAKMARVAEQYLYEALPYRTAEATFFLSPSAIEGLDYTRHEDIYVLKTREAIAVDENGNAMIEVIDRETLLQNQMDLLLQRNLNVQQQKSVARAIAMLVQPHLAESEVELTLKYLLLVKELNILESTDSLFQRSEILVYLNSQNVNREIFEFYLSRPWEHHIAIEYFDLLVKNPSSMNNQGSIVPYVGPSLGVLLRSCPPPLHFQFQDKYNCDI